MESAPTPEQQMMEVMRNIFQTSYALDEDDRNFIDRMIEWGRKKQESLSDEERAALKQTGFMDKDDSFLVPNEFWFRGIIMPSYWLKCLMGVQGMLTFSQFGGDKE